MSDIVERFRKALAEPHRLARWELAFGFPFAGVDHSQSLSLHLTRRGGEIARRLVTEIPAPYERNDDGDLFVAGGRSIRFSGKNKAFLRVGNEPILDRIFRAGRLKNQDFFAPRAGRGDSGSRPAQVR